MALFFDVTWFEGVLKARGLSRAQLGEVLGHPPVAIDDMFKDQREVTARDVVLLASLLGHPTEEIARRAGVSTPVPKAPMPDTASTGAAIEERLLLLDARLERMERSIADIRRILAAGLQTKAS